MKCFIVEIRENKGRNISWARVYSQKEAINFIKAWYKDAYKEADKLSKGKK